MLMYFPSVAIPKLYGVPAETRENGTTMRKHRSRTEQRKIVNALNLKCMHRAIGMVNGGQWGWLRCSPVQQAGEEVVFSKYLLDELVEFFNWGTPLQQSPGPQPTGCAQQSACHVATSVRD